MWYDSLLTFMKIGTGVHAGLRFYLSNLNGYDVDIVNGKDLQSVLLKWALVTLYTYQVL
jgi:hypothetical protein